MVQRIEYLIENFSAGMHTYRKLARGGGLYAKSMENLRCDSEGRLALRHAVESLSLGVSHIEGIAEDGRGGLFLHNRSGLHWYDGSTTREIRTNQNYSVHDLEGELSSVTTFVDYVLLTSAGSDPGYLIDFSDETAPVAYSMEVPAPHPPIFRWVDGSDDAEQGMWVPVGALYYLGPDPNDPGRLSPRVPIGVGPSMVWEYAFTAVRKLEIGGDDDRVKLGEMESELSQSFMVTLDPKEDGADDAFQRVMMSAWVFPADDSIYKINIYRRPHQYLVKTTGFTGVEDTYWWEINFSQLLAAGVVFEELKEAGFQSRDAVVDDDEDLEWEYRFVGSVEREEGSSHEFTDVFDNINVAGENTFQIAPEKVAPANSPIFRWGQVFEDASARAYSESNASGLPMKATQIAEYNTRIFAAAGDEARYSEIEFGNLLPWAYPAENAFRYPTSALFSHYGILYFGGGRGLWRLTGIELDYDVDKISDVGPVSANAWARSRTGGFIFIGEGGLWELKRSSIEPFGRPHLDALFENRRCERGAAAFLPNGSGIFTCYWDDNTSTQIFYDRTGAFHIWTGAEFDQAVRLEESDRVYILRNYGIANIRWDQVNNSNATQAWAWESQELDWSQSGLQAVKKHFRILDVLGDSSLTKVEAFVDGSAVASKYFRLDPKKPSRLLINRRGTEFRFKLSGTGRSTISSVRLMAQVPERRFR